MNASARGGYARGATPRAPGDLTARIHRENLQKADAAKKAQEAGSDSYEAGFASGWNKGFDAGFDGGFEVALTQLRDAGLDVDSVLALVAEDAEDE